MTRCLSLVIVSSVFLLGCTSVSYNRKEVNGETVSFSTSSLFSRKAIKDLEYGVGTNGTRKLSLKGYGNDQTEVMQSAIEAALAAYIRQQPAGTNK